jgi:hypothetical protein
VGITGANPFSMNAWMKTESYPTTGNYQDLYSLGVAEIIDHVIHVGLSFSVADTIFISSWGGVLDGTGASGVNLVNQFHMVTTTYDGTTLRVYVDSLNVFNKTGTLNINDNELYYGGRPGGVVQHYFDGVIDEVGLWNRTLTTNEISDLYNDGDGLAYN